MLELVLEYQKTKGDAGCVCYGQLGSGNLMPVVLFYERLEEACQF